MCFFVQWCNSWQDFNWLLAQSLCGSWSFVPRIASYRFGLENEQELRMHWHIRFCGRRYWSVLSWRNDNVRLEVRSHRMRCGMLYRFCRIGLPQDVATHPHPVLIFAFRLWEIYLTVNHFEFTTTQLWPSWSGHGRIEPVSGVQVAIQGGPKKWYLSYITLYERYHFSGPPT